MPVEVKQDRPTDSCPSQQAAIYHGSKQGSETQSVGKWIFDSVQGMSRQIDQWSRLSKNRP